MQEASDGRTIRVVHAKQPQQIELGAERDELIIVVPAEGRAYARRGDGAQVDAICAPQVVVEPRIGHKTACSQLGAGALLIALDLGFYRAQIPTALGFEAPAIAASCTLLSPLITEIGNSLREAVLASRGPGSLYLETCAVVIAIHLASCKEWSARKSC
jgi:hypothetical protein